METLRIPLAYTEQAEHEQVRLWSTAVPVVDEGADAAQWLSTFLKRSLRCVVAFPPSDHCVLSSTHPLDVRTTSAGWCG
jgi:uncharacterized protein YcbX